MGNFRCASNTSSSAFAYNKLLWSHDTVGGLGVIVCLLGVAVTSLNHGDEDVPLELVSSKKRLDITCVHRPRTQEAVIKHIRVV